MTTKTRAIFILRWTVVFIALAIPLCMITLFVARPDPFAAVTVWPAWVWLSGGLFGSIIFRSAIPKKIRYLPLGLWLIFGVLCCDEPVSLLRFRQLSEMQPAERMKSGVIRVISLNCGGGSPEALNEVVRFQPDIVLAQESPSSEDVAKTAERLYGNSGSFIYGVDASVIFKRKGKAVLLDLCCSVVDVELQSGSRLRVASIRLPTPSARLDLWSRDCWREYRVFRREHSRILGEYKKVLLESNTPTLIGGDFNMPARDGATRSLKPELSDAYMDSGSGLCNTIINDYPVHRIDQIWVSKDLQPQTMRVFKTVYSDHRMVVCDLSLEPRRSPRM